MNERTIKILLVLGIFILGFMYFNYDRVTSDETITIENVAVKTKDLGYVKVINGNIDYNIKFNKIGEEFIFSFDLKNDNIFDMNINKINITGTSDWLDYRIYDSNGNNISKDLVIKKNTKQKVYVALKYVKKINNLDNDMCKMGIDLKVSKV